MNNVEGRVIYGAGYEDQSDESIGASEGIDAAQTSTSSPGDTTQDVVSATVDTTQDVVSATLDTAQGAVSATVDTAQDVVVAAVDTAQGAVATVATTAQDVTSSVVDTAGDVISTATESVQQAASAVVDTAQQATSTVTSAVADKVEQVSDTVAGQVEQLADSVAQVAFSGDAPRVQRQVAATTVNVLDRTAEYLRTGDSDVILEDLRNMVRRHPLRSLAIGLGLGYLARGAFFSGSQQAAQSPRSAPLPPPAPVYGETSMGGYNSVDGGFTTTGYDAVYSSGSPEASSSAVIGTGTTGLANDVLGASTVDTMGGFGTLDTSGGSVNLASGTADTLTSPDLDAGINSGLATTLDNTSGGNQGLGGSLAGTDLGDEMLGVSTALPTELLGDTTDITTDEQFRTVDQEEAGDDLLGTGDASTRETNS